jgi:hypothetical protein
MPTLCINSIMEEFEVTAPMWYMNLEVCEEMQIAQQLLGSRQIHAEKVVQSLMEVIFHYLTTGCFGETADPDQRRVTDRTQNSVSHISQSILSFFHLRKLLLFSRLAQFELLLPPMQQQSSRSRSRKQCRGCCYRGGDCRRALPPLHCVLSHQPLIHKSSAKSHLKSLCCESKQALHLRWCTRTETSRRFDSVL